MTMAPALVKEVSRYDYSAREGWIKLNLGFVHIVDDRTKFNSVYEIYDSDIDWHTLFIINTLAYLFIHLIFIFRCMYIRIL